MYKSDNFEISFYMIYSNIIYNTMYIQYVILYDNNNIYRIKSLLENIE